MDLLRRAMLSDPLFPLMYCVLLAVVLAHYAWWSALGVLAELRLWRTGTRYTERERAAVGLPPTRARWLRVVRPVEYPFGLPHVRETRPWFDVGAWWVSAWIMPGTVGEHYLTLCIGRDRREALIAAGDVLVTTETYPAPPAREDMHRYYRWPHGLACRPCDEPGQFRAGFRWPDEIAPPELLTT